MELSIVVPTFQRADSVIRLLKSVDEQVFDFENLEVLIVSNYKDNQLEKKINEQKFESIHPIVEVTGKLGANASRNKGLSCSKGKYVLLLDDDCWLKEKNYLQKIVNYHDFNKDVCAIGGGYQLPGNSSIEDMAYNLISKEWQYIYHVDGGASTRLVGGNVSYKNDLLKSLGESYDEAITYGGSESEFHKRLSLKNVKMIYAPELKVYHASEITRDNLISKARKQALTHTQFDIDGGGYVEQKKSYQENPKLWALKLAKNNQEYHKILLHLDLYNWVYHSVAKSPETSLYKIKFQAHLWMKKRSRQLGMGRL